MTRYILGGGKDRYIAGYGPKLLREVAKERTPNVVLSCLFAEASETWGERFGMWRQWFADNFGRDTHIILAQPDEFVGQVRQADVVYLHGGSEPRLAGVLKPYGDLTELWKGKTVVGSSAGAAWLSRYYWGCDQRMTGKGSGIVPVNILVHYGSDYGSDSSDGPINWKKAEAELRAAIGPDEKITPLREGEFIVVKQ